ncbi:MAG: hypothetical protein ABI442_08510 [Gemmatimonadaceae bacterium]
MFALFFLGVAVLPSAAFSQMPLAPTAPTGQTATPAFEGWYKNPDGTFSLSFGYFNRNAAEVLSIPVGPDNSISPGNANQGQPTVFYPRRHWGVFAVRVPADFGGKSKVVWTLNVRGTSYAIPASLRPEWQIDALEGEAGSNNTPPVLTFGKGGPEARGPGGVSVDRTASVGKPITIEVVAKDDGAGLTKGGSPVTLTWFTHQGPAQVVFGTPTAKLTPTGGSTSTTATFSQPGDYILRVRANDSDVATAGHAQCCWTNAFVNVRVTP